MVRNTSGVSIIRGFEFVNTWGAAIPRDSLAQSDNVQFFPDFEILIQFGSKITHLAPENSEQAPGDLMTVEKQNEEGTQPQSVHSTFDTTLKT